MVSTIATTATVTISSARVKPLFLFMMFETIQIYVLRTPSHGLRSSRKRINGSDSWMNGAGAFRPGIVKPQRLAG